MNSIEDIAKMAIEEVGAELKELENSRIPTKAPKPLRAANDALNAIVKNDEAAQLNAASVMKENENTLNITNTNSNTSGSDNTNISGNNTGSNNVIGNINRENNTEFNDKGEDVTSK